MMYPLIAEVSDTDVRSYISRSFISQISRSFSGAFGTFVNHANHLNNFAPPTKTSADAQGHSQLVRVSLQHSFGHK